MFPQSITMTSTSDIFHLHRRDEVLSVPCRLRLLNPWEKKKKRKRIFQLTHRIESFDKLSFVSFISKKKEVINHDGRGFFFGHPRLLSVFFSPFSFKQAYLVDKYGKLRRESFLKELKKKSRIVSEVLNFVSNDTSKFFFFDYFDKASRLNTAGTQHFVKNFFSCFSLKLLFHFVLEFSFWDRFVLKYKIFGKTILLKEIIIIGEINKRF